MLFYPRLNEKFTDDSDPVNDLGIGVRHYIKKWFEYYSYPSPLTLKSISEDDYVINNDNTINMLKSLDLNGVGLTKFPSYIKFNEIHGDFIVNWNNFENMKNFPKIVHSNLYINGNPLISLEGCPEVVEGVIFISHVCGFSEEDILKKCKCNGITLINDHFNKYSDVFRDKKDYYKGKRIGNIKDYVFEKFIEDSDPIKDLGIGIKYIWANLKSGDILKVIKHISKDDPLDSYIKIESVYNKNENEKQITYTSFKNIDDLIINKINEQGEWDISFNFFKNHFELVSYKYK